VLFLNHALVQPPVDRHRPPDEVADVYVHVEKETDAGLIVQQPGEPAALVEHRLLDDLVGSPQHRLWNREAESLRGFQVDH